MAYVNNRSTPRHMLFGIVPSTLRKLPKPDYAAVNKAMRVYVLYPAIRTKKCQCSVTHWALS